MPKNSAFMTRNPRHPRNPRQENAEIFAADFTELHGLARSTGLVAGYDWDN
jgi:hypothetical protein